ncbi:hypothetical protein [Bradyrhizobium liaoningense]|uniref:hypothetical protein n=1 Tax=Bradyrhizobium liaoningense TaxID=43992 RepID=UPI001BAB992A|nr:hypothetical protein [Bradyrhizobium liaoningense]MBR0902639.1 hypothetical protein [Bradyrhizobium liaoningense]
MTTAGWPMLEGPGSELSDKLKRRMDLVLEETFRDELPNGGDHETRKLVAARLLAAAVEGRTTLGELGLLARKAMAELKRKPK